MIEPIGAGDFDPAVVVGRPDEDVGAGATTSVPCPGCASPLTTQDSQALVHCPSCGSWAKIERVLSADDVVDGAYPIPTHRFGFLRARREARDAERDAVLDRALTAESDTEAVGRLLAFTPWEALTPDREERLIRLLEDAPRSSLLDRASCVVVRRLLVEAPHDAIGLDEHPWRYLVLRSIARVAFRPGASGRLIQELRHVYGGGAAVKLLLDVADYALGEGWDDYAEDALDVLGHALQQGVWDARHDRTAVLLYRLPYVDERIAAWLLTQISWLWTVDARLVARLVDDLGLERPSLAALVANGVTYATSRGFDDYIDHVRFLWTLFTPLARAVALESYVHVPAGISADRVDEARFAIETFLALEDDHEAGIAATKLLRWWADALDDESPEALASIAAALRARLPEEPTWPRPLRPSVSEEELEALATSLRDGVEQRSRAEVGTEEEVGVREVVEELDDVEGDLAEQTRRWRYGRA
ncbi:MAG: hypothetical protein AAF389_21095 [Gemmatimonadota bacterium]